MADILDFLPEWDKDPDQLPEKQTVDQMKEILYAIAAGRKKIKKK